jgi:DNA-binding MarR family transcriptional regulator
MPKTEIDALHVALMDVVGIVTRPQPDIKLLNEAGVTLDRALAPLLVRVSLKQPIGIVELAELVGRDHSTISRQIAKMEEAGLVAREPRADGTPSRNIVLTAEGRSIVDAIRKARRRILSEVLAGWSDGDRTDLIRLLRKFAQSSSDVLL